MIENTEHEGFWWLPGSESERLFGTLRLNRGRPELKVAGHFGHKVLSESESEIAYSFDLADHPKILGVTTDGKAVTLEDCSSHGLVLPVPGTATAVYQASFALFGAHFEEDEIAGFDALGLRLSDLDEWARVSGFSRPVVNVGDGPSGASPPLTIHIEYNRPPAIDVPLDNGESLQLDFHVSGPTLNVVATSMSVSQRAELRYRFASRVSLQDVSEKVIQLRNFLSLAVGRPVSVMSVTGFRDDFREPQHDFAVPIKIFWAIPHNPDPPTRSLHPRSTLFTLPEAVPHVSDVMKRWFARQQVFKPVLSLYFAMTYHPDMFLDIRFLAFTQALETYDFRRRDPYELSPEKHERRLEQILNTVPEQWRSWLETKLLSSNYRTLGKRVRDVLAECPTVSAKIVGENSRKRSRFIKRLTDSRNYYTHYSTDLEAAAATGIELYLLMLQVRTILEMSLLRELGFSEDAIDAVLDRAERYARIENIRTQIREARAAKTPNRAAENAELDIADLEADAESLPDEAEASPAS